MSANITETLKQLTDVLTEDSLKEIETALEEAVTNRVQIHVEKALVEQDEDHAHKVQHLLEAIDNDHTTKLEKLVEAIDQDRSDKLKNIIMKYETVLGEEANSFKRDLISKVSNYLELYIEQAIPTNAINDAVANKKSNDMLKEMRKLLGVNMAVAQKSIKAAIVDGKRQINAATETANTIVKENDELKGELHKAQVQLLLNTKTDEMPEDKKRYMYKIMDGKTPQFIVENFDYTANLFDKSEEERLEELTNQATRAKRASVIDRPRHDPVITEAVQSSPDGSNDPWDDAPYRSDYMGELQKF
jgi:hypothetical protein